MAQRELYRKRARQIALFAGILISGGLLTIPREPLLAIVLLICFTLKSPLRLFRPEFIGIWMLLLLVAAAALIGGESFQIGAFVIRYANFLAGMALLLVYVEERRSTLADDLYWIFKLMAFQAVLTPVLAIVIADYFWIFQNGDAVYHTFLYIFTWHDLSGTSGLFKRADGFFFEPGVFQIYLNMFLFITLFVRKQRPFDIALATLGVLATQSTTGVVIMVIQFCAAYFVWVKTASRRQKLVVFLFVPMLILPLGAYTTYNVTEKFYGALSGSAEAREYDLRTGISVALEQPLTGIGFDYNKYFEVASRVGYREVELSTENITERPNSNGLVTLFYSVGIPLALIFLLGFLRQRLFRPGLVMAAIALLSLTAESLAYTPIFLMLCFSGLLVQTQTVSRFTNRLRPGTAISPPHHAV